MWQQALMFSRIVILMQRKILREIWFQEFMMNPI